jgi:phage tail tape-measure protein
MPSSRRSSTSASTPFAGTAVVAPAASIRASASVSENGPVVPVAGATGGR